MVRDKLIIGLYDDKLRERLLRSDRLTLEKAVEICRATEMSRIHSHIVTHSHIVHFWTQAVVASVSSSVSLQTSALWRSLPLCAISAV